MDISVTDLLGLIVLLVIWIYLARLLKELGEIKKLLERAPRSDETNDNEK